MENFILCEVYLNYENIYGLIHTTQGKCRKDSSNKYDCVYKLTLSKSVCAVSKHKQNILFSKIS